MEIDFYLLTISTLEKLIKESKPFPIRYCKKCNKKMRVIKNDFIKRQFCKKCHFEK